jgi:hypothetical protein
VSGKTMQYVVWEPELVSQAFLFLSTGNNFHPAEQMICRGCLGQQIKQWCFFKPLIFY